MSKYAYKYTPNDKALEWLKNQKNKSASLDILITKAINQQGTGDIFENAINLLLSNNGEQPIHPHSNVNQPNENQSEIFEKNNFHEESSNFKIPQPEPSNVEPEKNAEPPKSRPNPNLGFLSK